jgi:predicted P-loop ATPase
MQTDQATMQDSDKAVTAYLASLKWDGKPRLDRWLIDCAGAEDTAYVRTVSRGMLLAAVRRARNPGCRFDQMPILEGP